MPPTATNTAIATMAAKRIALIDFFTKFTFPAISMARHAPSVKQASRLYEQKRSAVLPATALDQAMAAVDDSGRMTLITVIAPTVLYM